MKVHVDTVRAKDLMPGDLFSSVGATYWDRMTPGAVGERVYIRTDVPCPPDQADDEIFRITIER